MSSSSQPATKLHAATVVVMRPTQRHDDVEIYMVRRSAKSPFMPSTLVFPGGRLDPEDGSPEEDASWRRAAIRECREETSLDIDEEISWFDTWLTPSAESKRRYLTRFFWTTVTRAEGDRAEADGHETHDGRWATASAHLDAWRQETVDLPPPTLCTLLRLAPHASCAGAALRNLDPNGVILPKVHVTSTRVQIVMPHDAAYDDLPGEGMPAPPRVRTLPTRLTRAERVWTLDDSSSPSPSP